MSREALRSALMHVEEAKRELVSAIPSPRGHQEVTLAEALMGFEEALRAARTELDAAEPGEPRERCGAAIAGALDRAEALRLEAPELDYEGLVAALGELMDPLDAFAELESRIQAER